MNYYGINASDKATRLPDFSKDNTFPDILLLHKLP